LSKTLRFVLALVVAVAAVIGLLLFGQSRDRSTFSDGASRPPASGPHLPEPVRREAPLSRDQLLHVLELGDVVLFYGRAADAAALRAIADDVSGPFDPALAAAGQSVLVDRRPGTRGVVAVAWRHVLEAPSGRDPRLRTFTEALLGKGARG
jgi:hypothetical protein